MDTQAWLRRSIAGGLAIKDARGRWSHPTRRWKRRLAVHTQGLVLHQTAGGDHLDRLGCYHTQPGVHIGDGLGLPGVAYTFFIDKTGKVTLVNDLEDVTWSHGDPKQDGDENALYMSACLGGNFAPSGPETPTGEQAKAVQALWSALREAFQWTPLDLLGHDDFGKPGCPGVVVRGWINAEHRKAVHDLDSIRGRQAALLSLGYAVGPVDGRWGLRSQTALLTFQRAHQVPGAGSWNAATLRAVYRTLLRKSILR